MNDKVYTYGAKIMAAERSGGAFAPFLYDIRAEFGKGRVKVRAMFGEVPYDGSVVSMGAMNPDGSACCFIGILREIRAKIGKQPGDSVHVTIQERT